MPARGQWSFSAFDLRESTSAITATRASNDAEAQVDQITASTSPDRMPVGARAAPRRGTLLRVAGAAATLAVGLSAAIAWRWDGKVEQAQYRTAIGALQTLPLADGSTLTLSSDSAVAVTLSRRQRRVELVQGEAIFEVAKDGARPFVVDATGSRITAVGTRFAVRRSEDGLRVIVTEGTVEDRVARLLETASLPAGERYGSLLEVFPPALRAELYAPGLPPPRIASSLLGPAPAPGVGGLQLLDARTYLPDDLLVKADRASMATSLELRSPLLDHTVLELGVSLPDALKLDGRRGKAALRRAFAHLLPPELRERRKTGFGIPLGDWFRGPLRDLAGDVLLGQRARTRGQLRPAAVERLLREHVRGQRDHGHRLWCLLVLELWQRTWLDAEARPLSYAAERA